MNAEKCEKVDKTTYFHIESMRVWVSKLGNESIKIYKINQVWQKERMRIYDYKSMRYESLRLLEYCTYEVWGNGEDESIRLLESLWGMTEERVRV